MSDSKAPSSASSASSSAAPQQQQGAFQDPGKGTPTTVIVIGMAGSGKTTLLQRLNAHVHQNQDPSYFINLDPAVSKVPYGANIDIRDTVNYKEVMKQYNLGPNGGILTSLNLFATRFDQVLQFVEKRADSLKHIFIDTPGQIEIFTWSASGTIIADSLAASFPTVVVYVVDTPRNSNPVTFMSNMLYACSIMYKTKVPFLIAFNKCDVVSHEFALRWMNDLDEFTASLRSDDSYMTTLTRSMSLVLDEFYKNLRAVGVSAVTGSGMNDARKEYYEEYLPVMQRVAEEKKAKEESIKQSQMQKLAKDVLKSKGQKVVMGKAHRLGREGDNDEDEDEGDEDEAEADYGIDPADDEVEDEEEEYGEIDRTFSFFLFLRVSCYLPYLWNHSEFIASL